MGNCVSDPQNQDERFEVHKEVSQSPSPSSSTWYENPHSQRRTKVRKAH